MFYQQFAEGVKHFKETEKGRENMCDAVQEYAKEYADGEKENYIRKMLSKGYAKEEIADIINVSVTEVKAVAEGKALV